MHTLNEELEKNIKKLIKPLKVDEELIPILRKRLTKKEYKLIQMMANETPLDQIYQKLNMEKENHKLLRGKLIKKINQEKLKQELMI